MAFRRRAEASGRFVGLCAHRNNILNHYYALSTELVITKQAYVSRRQVCEQVSTTRHIQLQDPSSGISTYKTYTSLNFERL